MGIAAVGGDNEIIEDESTFISTFSAVGESSMIMIGDFESLIDDSSDDSSEKKLPTLDVEASEKYDDESFIHSSILSKFDESHFMNHNFQNIWPKVGPCGPFIDMFRTVSRGMVLKIFFLIYFLTLSVIFCPLAGSIEKLLSVCSILFCDSGFERVVRIWIAK